MAEENDRQENDMRPLTIGSPTNICHVSHVTFDRFDGFLGLPSEFELVVPKKSPSASATVFGVSTESMQLSYDSRGNCVPIILVLLQNQLYDQGGLQMEGIFRITGDNSEEENVREQLNNGLLPEGIDVHCLAGLIKAWFRELPRGILDPLPSEQVMQCESEEDFVRIVRLLPENEASLLNWTINLMADIVEFEHVNKMTSRNLALVFAPNMSQMADPLRALMYAVQVMKLLKILTDKTVRERITASSQVDHCGNSSEEDSDNSSEEDGDEEADKTVRERITASSQVDHCDNSSEEDSDNSSEEDGDEEEYNQEEMHSFEEEYEDAVEGDIKDKTLQAKKESEKIALHSAEHRSSSELDTNNQKKRET